jgi:hypothetical protein
MEQRLRLCAIDTAELKMAGGIFLNRLLLQKGLAQLFT